MARMILRSGTTIIDRYDDRVVLRNVDKEDKSSIVINIKEFLDLCERFLKIEKEIYGKEKDWRKENE